MLRISFLVTLFIVTTLILPNSLQAENADSVFAFALHLKERGEFYRAVTEFERFRFLFPDENRSSEALEEIIDCFFQAGQYEKAALACETFLDSYPQASSRQSILVRMVECYYLTTKYGEGAGELEFFLAEYPNDPLKPQALKLLGFIQLKAKQWQNAEETFTRLAQFTDSPLSRSARIAVDDLQNGSLKKHRSPFFSGLLSAALPGAGQLYCGRPGDAFASLSINGLFTYVTVVSFQQKNYVLGGLMALIELGWYSGNIYSAVNSAHKFNLRQDEKLIDFVQSHFTPHLSRQNRGSYGLSFVLAF